MKIQGVTVIFSLIVIPIILVLSYYIQIQVDTIALQSSYDTKLLDATHDAMAAFEINTANEKLSSVADSLRSIITASNNVFINSLSTNLGMSNASKGMIQPYIPAVLYTLYDGYYIYSPTKIPVVLKNAKGNAVVVGDEGVAYSSDAGDYNIYTYIEPPQREEDDEDYSDEEDDSLVLTKHQEEYGQILYEIEGQEGKYITVVKEGLTKYKLDYVLKSFMPYSARYINRDIKGGAEKYFDVTINYTLDNYMIITGMVDEVYYSKSGYLIKDKLLDKVMVDDNETEGNDLLSRNEEEIDSRVDEIVNQGRKITIYVKSMMGNTEELIPITTNSADGIDAVKYYLKSTIFSNWVYNNLKDIEEGDISRNAIEIQNFQNKNLQNQQFQIVNSFENSTKKIFRVEADGTTFENPEKNDSYISTHKSEIIRNSIQYNLNVAMSTYNEMSTKAFSFNMPVISDSEWKKITSNVSVVSFMQGFRCGLKIYNNYAIVSSTNNEITVIPSEIYYVANDETKPDEAFNDENSTYHRIDCPDFIYPETTDGSEISNLGFRFFKSKETKYDKIYNKNQSIYEYDHKNIACYKCIVNGNYKKPYFDGAAIVPAEDGKYSNELDITVLPKQKQRLYFTAVGAERQRLYKANAIKKSQGMESTLVDSTSNNEATVDLTSKNNISEIKEIHIVISDIKCSNNANPIAKFNVEANGVEIGNDIALNIQRKEQTIELTVDIKDSVPLTKVTVKKVQPEEENITFTIKEVEIIYK